MTDDLDRKIALSIDPTPEWKDRFTEYAEFSMSGVWWRPFTGATLVGPGPFPVSFLEPEMSLMLWKKLLDKFGNPALWKVSTAMASIPVISGESPKLASELWEEAVRLAYARAEGLE